MNPMSEIRAQQVASASPNATAGLNDLRFKARKNVEEAIKQFIPMERKAAYLEALQKAPHLFETESDPMKFLRRCDYNIWQASERLCLYWKLRKEIFGPERFHLPLILTGNGALNQNDILSLQGGFPALLPSSKAIGGHVLYCDRRQNVPSLPAIHRLRGLFYVIQILSEDERAQTEGVSVFVLLVATHQHRRIQEVDYDFVSRALFFGRHAVPIKTKLHLLNSLPTTKTTSTPSSAAASSGSGSGGGGIQAVVDHRKLYAVQDLITRYMRQVECATHGVDCVKFVEVHFERQDGLFLKLFRDDYGIDPSRIPTALGGSWSSVEWATWCREQAVAERQQYKWLFKKSAPVAAAAAAAASSAIRSGSGKQMRKRSASPEDRQAAAAIDDNDKQSKLTKKRAINVIYSRRKRERNRYEAKVMMEERDRLQSEQDDLKMENARLEELWQQALSISNTV